MTRSPTQRRSQIKTLQNDPDGLIRARPLRSTVGDPPRLCGPCEAGNHEHCFIAVCWRCPGVHRSFGVGSPMASATHGLTS